MAEDEVIHNNKIARQGRKNDDGVSECRCGVLKRTQGICTQPHAKPNPVMLIWWREQPQEFSRWVQFPMAYITVHGKGSKRQGKQTSFLLILHHISGVEGGENSRKERWSVLEYF